MSTRYPGFGCYFCAVDHRGSKAFKTQHYNRPHQLLHVTDLTENSPIKRIDKNWSYITDKNHREYANKLEKKTYNVRELLARKQAFYKILQRTDE